VAGSFLVEAVCKDAESCFLSPQVVLQTGDTDSFLARKWISDNPENTFNLTAACNVQPRQYALGVFNSSTGCQ